MILPGRCRWDDARRAPQTCPLVVSAASRPAVTPPDPACDPALRAGGEGGGVLDVLDQPAEEFAPVPHRVGRSVCRHVFSPTAPSASSFAKASTSTGLTMW